MSQEIELEQTYLAKYLPKDLKSSSSKEIVDIYFPKNSPRANLRLRKSGDTYVITKKTKVSPDSSSVHLENSISLSESEFLALELADGNKIVKTRYYYPCGQKIAEIDIFSGQHKGLVLVDFEFSNAEEMNDFKMPDFCLADVTEEEIIAGGVLSHETMSSVMKVLEKFSYKEIN